MEQKIKNEKIKINKPIRLIEFFAGYGSQALSLKYLGVPFESWRICEWTVKSIQAYKDIHFGNDNTDYVSSNNMDQSQVENYLLKLGISNNYNELMTLKQIHSKGFTWQKQVLNNIIATHNLVNIQRVKAKHLNIIDTSSYTYILTYSFPCQDLSIAGNRKGMSDTSTRSGMLWEVERILKELYDQDIHIPILLMENVPQVHNKNNINDFNKWTSSLESMGYRNYWQDLNAKDYGIPQNRNRCFMVSIYGDYEYTFPQKKQLQLRLKDMLEDNVDEKYYLSQKMLNCFLSDGTEKYRRKERFIGNLTRKNKDTANCITTRAGSRPTDNYIVERLLKEELCDKLINEGLVKEDNVDESYYLNEEKIKNTIFKSIDGVIIPEATKKGYSIAYDGDGVYTNRPHQKRGCVQKGMIQTIKTQCNDIGVVVKKNTENYIEGEEKGKIDIDCQAYNDLRIRKLTPRECGRLMGVLDNDITIMEKNQSNSSLYHLFGDSIVVNVLMCIFKEML